MKVVCCSFPFTLAWMFELHRKYLAAHSAHGSEAKARRIEACICDVFEAAKLGCAALSGPPPSITVGGIKMLLGSDLKMDLGAVVHKFKSMPREWNFMREQGAVLKPRVPWSARSTAVETWKRVKALTGWQPHTT